MVINYINSLNDNPDVPISPHSPQTLSKTELLKRYKTLGDFYNGTRTDNVPEEGRGLGPTTGCGFNNDNCVQIKKALKKLWSNEETKKGGRRKNEKEKERGQDGNK